MKCPSCGEEVAEGAKFCPFCSSPLDGPPPPSPTAPAPVAAPVVTRLEEPGPTPPAELVGACPVCGYHLSERAAYCRSCRCKLAYCAQPGCAFIGVAGRPLCPQDFAPLSAPGRSWRQKFADGGNSCSMPEATRLFATRAPELVISPDFDSDAERRCSSATCDGRLFCTTDYAGRLLRVGIDRQRLEPINVRGGAPEHLAPVLVELTAWLAVADGARVCGVELGERLTQEETDLEGGQVTAGLVHNGKWMAAAGRQADGSGAIWVWGRSEVLVWQCPAPVAALPAWSDDRLLVAAGERLACLAVSADDLQEAWHEPLGGAVGGHVTAVPGPTPAVATVTVQDRRTVLTLRSVLDGGALWEASVPGRGLPSEGASTDGRCLFLAVGSQVLMFDVQGGNLVAQWELGAEIWSPVTVTADVALVGAGGRVVVIDRVSGRQTVVDLPLAEPPVETVVVYSDSWIAVSDERGLRAWQSAM